MAYQGAAKVVPPSARAVFRILATTDLHMNILPYDYFSDQPNDTLGLARTASLIRVARDEVENAILVDNGDSLAGTPMADAFFHRLKTAPPDQPTHPMVAVMNHLKYDTATLGNHDFDAGVGGAMAAVSHANFPFVLANTVQAKAQKPVDDRALLAPYTILERHIRDTSGRSHKLRIGIIGFLPPRSIPYVRDADRGLFTRDIIETARAYVPLMRQRGADIILALAHSGIGGVDHVTDMENAVIPLAGIDGVDAIIAGHNHQIFPNAAQNTAPCVDSARGTILGKPVVKPGFWGSHLGVIDLELTQSGRGWRVHDHKVQARAIYKRDNAGKVIPTAGIDQGILDLISPTHQRTLARTRQPVARNHEPLHSYFATIAPSNAVQLIQHAQIWYVKQHLQTQIPASSPLLSAAAPFKCGGFGGPGFYTLVQTGGLRLRAISDLYYYPNDLAILQADANGVADWLERAASIFNRVTPGQRDGALKTPQAPGYHFDTILGLTYGIDLTQPARYSPAGVLRDPSAQRVRNLLFEGRPIPAGQKFHLITNSYRASGGGRYPLHEGLQRCQIPTICVRDILRKYICEVEDLNLRPTPNWRFAPADGARVTFRSSPESTKFLNDVPDHRLQYSGLDGDGFARYHLTL